MYSEPINAFQASDKGQSTQYNKGGAPYRLLLLGVGVARVVVVVGGVGLAPGGLGAVGATARLCSGIEKQERGSPVIEAMSFPGVVVRGSTRVGIAIAW